MKKVLMECSLFYKELGPKKIELLIINDAKGEYSITEASNKTIVELDPVVLSSKLMEAFLFGLDAKGYKQVENTYEI